jgi:hypothetical protein
MAKGLALAFERFGLEVVRRRPTDGNERGP